MAPKVAGQVTSEAKEMHPLNASQALACDHENIKVLLSLYQRTKKEKESDSCERVVHTLMCALRLHNQCMIDTVLPALTDTEKGGKMGEKLQKMLTESEQNLETLKNTKKHFDNKDFGKVMTKVMKGINKQIEMGEEAMAAIADEHDEEGMVDMAQTMEGDKMDAPMVFQKTTQA
jgi:flagellar hook-basal body complex protein FliE